jgi:hypothetical protein
VSFDFRTVLSAGRWPIAAARRRRKASMSRKSRLRAAVALFVVIACIPAVPAMADTTAFTWDSLVIPAKLWDVATDWLRGFGSAFRVQTGHGNHKQPTHPKLGAGQSSDGHSGRGVAY